MKRNKDEHLWYKDAVIYELHLKAFFDSNDDGTGDLEGLIGKLDYLKDLGVTAIWILPFYPSPLRDDGYDISDYYNIQPAYGDLATFERLVTEAHGRGLKIITELVINHTSDQHSWFQRARRAPKNSLERAYYVWSDHTEKYKDARIIFQDFETSNWTWDPVAGQYYWHRFFHHQPDLNFDNEAVRAEVIKVLDFWCQKGVDGFRLDAVPYLFEREGTNCENLPETHRFLKELRAHVDANYPGTLLLAEANMWPEDAVAYFGSGDECHMNYHFPVMPRMFMALHMEDRYPITDIFDQTPPIPFNCQWAIFLRNHDELTLEMVTDEERDYMYKVYVSDPKARINLGIRQRLAPLLLNNRRKIELINALLFSLPGTPVIYYGDEICMGDNFYLGDRDGVRTPMQWSPAKNAGFSNAMPHKLYLPLILDPEYRYDAVNVEMQLSSASSPLWFMKRIIELRKKHLAFSRGDFNIVPVDNPKVLAFTRTFEAETLLIVINLSRFAQPAEADLQPWEGNVPTELQSRNKFPVIKNVPYFFSLDAYSFYWFSLYKVASGLEDHTSAGPIQVNSLQDLVSGAFAKELLEDILPSWLPKTRWFGGKGNEILSIITEQTEWWREEAAEFAWMSIRVNYYYGLSELYLLPLTFVEERDIDAFRDFPQSIISPLYLKTSGGWLCDALFDSRLHRLVLQRALEPPHQPGINWSEHVSLRESMGKTGYPESRMLQAEQSNTSVIYKEHYYLKFYRKLDYDINPDVEMSRLLTRLPDFQHIPDFLGHLEWQTAKGNVSLAMMQELVTNHGDAWTYMQEKLRDYNERILTMPTEEQPLIDLEGNLATPYPFESLPEHLRSFFDPAVAEQVKLIGQRTAELHVTLCNVDNHPDFRSEEYSLHYQRSLYAALNAQMRQTFQSLEKKLDLLSEPVKIKALAVLEAKGRILEFMKAIYEKKINLLRFRIHGDYHLGQILFTGKDLVILDFEGEPARRYSERRFKFSGLKDVAGMIRSFHYAAYGSLFLAGNTREEDVEQLLPFSDAWSHYISGFFLHAYLESVRGTRLIPDRESDLELLLKIFLLSKAFYELNYELNNRPDWLIIPIRGILSIVSSWQKDL